MKQGDKVPVTIAGQVVAQATVKELGDGTVTLVVPGTLVVMAVRTEIAPPTAAAVEGETVITGVDREVVTTSAGTPEVEMPPVTAPSETAETPAAPAPVEPTEQTNPVVSDEGNQDAQPQV